MKKLSILAMCVAATFGASAQMDVVKEAEGKTKGMTPDYAQALEIIQPALTNDATKGLAQTWYVAGKAAFGNYDKMFANKTLGQDVDDKTMGHSLIDGYTYMMTALPLDSVTDAKGKVKTKYSKDIVKAVTENFNNYNNAAILLWEAQDYDGAYQAWDIYLSLPNDARLGKNAPAAPADTIVSELTYNKGLAAWQAGNIPAARKDLAKALKLGYNKKNLYDYAISLAYQEGDEDAVYNLAKEALPLYGSEDTKYMQLIINNHISKKEYDKAKQMLNEAIAANPNDSQYYLLLGLLATEQKDPVEAEANYTKAVEIDPNNANAQLFLGSTLCEKAYALADQSTTLSQAEYEKVYSNQIKPLFLQAIEHLEKAYAADPEGPTSSDALRYLRNAYYNAHDEANMERITNLMNGGAN